MSDDMRAVAARALAMVDLTNLNDDCTADDIDTLIARADTPHGPVAAICIWPRFVAHARAKNAEINIATVVNFPSGNEAQDSVVTQTAQAIADGANEIDLVLPYRAFADGDHDRAGMMVSAVAAVCNGKALLKVILETGELVEAGLIAEASRLAISKGADFIKTSTGKVAINATKDAAQVMMTVIADGNRTVGFKPAGGIRSTRDAAAYLAMADEIVGEGWATPDTFRFGASGVLDDLLAVLDGKESEVGEGY
ncbi:deoxyribose-phosphate aldolase [Ahrensia sp. R2A130]|uniref:deoxyribose-phosphate aldolase n=1 Tax=Ahrensia sp. R2A130 TaxID=744979 RepID=UPI0001E0A4D2|nr:deoxyribose-phosphate aldolase [Ahrensia sp. R2A130]EFL88436.1 deoxyribose-phosphate aldolase [Ahrensia sp. R2A130]